MRKSLSLTGFGLVAATLLGGAGAAQAAPTVLDHDGTYGVGADIAPGDYVTYSASGLCAWARLTAYGDVIESGNGASGTLRIRIASTDAAFSTTGCGVWRTENANRPSTGSATGSFGL
ncbi:hypothetical protein D5S18_24130 [Nocardia panacis]|uniref:Uncharacterized protein n=1 Tax=Nocardia panacis TaxID=2340916 RepID=A0A3A4KAZ3_9NOCA|nr:hypothetical protein [Nocardia panacis]RJO72248.1 hypothetical protein D5S18_24130 [Nocardia panacis]